MLKSIRPDAYAIAAKARVAIAIKPVAKPSRPSVRLTAFDVPVMTIIVSGVYSQPIFSIPLAINGMEINVE